ncbi:hypothetical protein [Pseudomonas sp. Pseu.R1]|uniref:hypothetical protein n=1 Tax=Pseudomonas sp. Pseu.R1 TaxID=3379818 RepID=UPI003B95D792
MKTVLHAVALASIVQALVGCTQQRYEPIVSTAEAPAEQWSFKPVETKYLSTQSSVWNFQHVLEQSAEQCGQEAAMGYILSSQLRDYGSSKRPNDRAQSLADCQQYANQQGNEAIARLNSSVVSPKSLELSKALYSQWKVYLTGMTIYSPKDRSAEARYQTSRQALLAEDKFAK